MDLLAQKTSRPLSNEGEGLVGEGAAELLEGRRGVVVPVFGTEQVVHLLEGPEAAAVRVLRLPEGGGNHLYEVCRLLETAVLLHQHGNLLVVGHPLCPDKHQVEVCGSQGMEHVCGCRRG